MSKIKIEIDTIEDTFEIDGVKYQVFQKAQLESFFLQLKSCQGDIHELKKAVISILSLLGLIDPETGAIKAEIQSGEEGYLKHILKSLNRFVFAVTSATFSPKARKQLEEDFSFMKTALPVINKYATKKDNGKS